MKKWIIGLCLVLLAFLLPVAVKFLSSSDVRSMSGIPIDDLNYSEVRFHNSVQDIELAGLLFLPEGRQSYPLAVVIHGSGSSHRSNGWYSTMAHDLVEQGIAVLLPDKRGSEQSEGDWRSSSFEDLATDTLAAVRYVDSRDDLAITEIGLLGMSQGGWIAPVAASQSSKVGFVVAFSGSAVTPTEQLYYEEVHNLKQMGLLPGLAEFTALLSTTYIRDVAQKTFWQGIENFDPMHYWDQVNARVLFVLGEEDTNVPVADSIRMLQGSTRPGINYVVFPGSGHALQEPPETGNRIIRHDAIEAITKFIETRQS